jgi:hypothetical protein
MSSKPIEEYYLYDHGDGNGWEVAAKDPGRWYVTTTSNVTEDRGVIQLDVEQYFHGALNTVDHNTFMICPEEARHLGEQLLKAAEEGEAQALSDRFKAGRHLEAMKVAGS